jgi:hypothetical protein
MRKKGVSPLIGYVLLVVGIMVVSVIVYNWLQTYVPKEGAECPDSASILIKDVNCYNNLSGSATDNLKLSLTIKNNGRFNLDGFFIHATNSSEQELATIDLVQYLPRSIAGTEIKLFKDGREPLKPGEEESYLFTTQDYSNFETIEIIPAKIDIIDGKNRFTSCGEAKVKEILNCQIYTN